MTAAARLIAIVDSDQGVRRAVARLLGAHGFRVQAFASAEAFLARGRMDEPACLVLDLALEGMSGFDLLHRLAADGSSIPTVAMTAADDGSTQRRAIAVGCAAFLSKPASADRLLATIDEAMRSGDRC